METKEYPIVLMFGIGNNVVQGFSIVYQTEAGHADYVNVWYEDPSKRPTLFDKVVFIDKGESCVILEKVPKEGFFNKGKFEWIAKEIRIRKDFQQRMG